MEKNERSSEIRKDEQTVVLNCNACDRSITRIPPGCAACGNPAYPKCKSSCPMFDD
jgi:predicted amidophosphoribosyltransferase